MEIYQGEPLGFKINIKGDDDVYLPSLEGIRLEALVANQYKSVVAKWSTDNGMDIGVETIDGRNAGYVVFGLRGTQTAELKKGTYTMELAKVVDDGRAIGVLQSVVIINEALIKKGV